MTAKRRHRDHHGELRADEHAPAQRSSAANRDRLTSHEAVGAQRMHYRRLVHRYNWTAAHNRLRDARCPFEAEARHEQHAVLVRTTAAGADALGRLGTPTAATISDPAVQAPLPARDALDVAFARAAEQSRHGRKLGARRA